MIAWWIHLSFSHGMIVLILATIAICLLGCLVGQFIRVGMASDPPRPQGDWDVIDYSKARAKALEQLGPDYLLATPVNRIGRSTQ